MTQIILYTNKDYITGYEAKGHSTNNVDDFDGKLVCSAVSSAVIMTANTITEIIRDNSDVEVKDGYLKVKVHTPNNVTNVVLEGLKLHLFELCNEYPNKIKVIMEEENHD